MRRDLLTSLFFIQIMIDCLGEVFTNNSFFKNNSYRTEINMYVCLYFCDKMLWFATKWTLDGKNGKLLLDWRAKVYFSTKKTEV